MASAVSTTQKPPGAWLGRAVRRPEMGSFLGLIAVFVFFAAFGGKVFVSPAGFASWLNVAAEIGIIALPIRLLMIAGELDLSVGAVIPAASLTLAIVTGHYGMPEIVGIAAALSVGRAAGFVNGHAVNRTGVSSLIITIGTMFAVMGLTLGLAVMLTGSTSTARRPGFSSPAMSVMERTPRLRVAQAGSGECLANDLMADAMEAARPCCRSCRRTGASALCGSGRSNGSGAGRTCRGLTDGVHHPPQAGTNDPKLSFIRDPRWRRF